MSAVDPATLGIAFIAVLAFFGGAFALMVLGQRASGRCLRGSCGGNGGCPDCPNRHDESAAQGPANP